MGNMSLFGLFICHGVMGTMYLFWSLATMMSWGICLGPYTYHDVMANMSLIWSLLIVMS